MTTKFIYDRIQKEREETIEQIFEQVSKEPYPKPETTILANFVEALFQTNMKEPEKKHEIHKHHKLHEKRPLLKPLPSPPKPAEKIAAAPKEPTPEAPKEEPKEPVPAPPQPAVPKDNKSLTPKAEQKEQSEDLLPPAPSNKQEAFESQSYIIKTFNTDVNIEVKKDDSGNALYSVNEPLVKKEVIKRVKEYIKKDFEKDFQVLDKPDYINKKIEKACKKEDIKCDEETIKDVLYYLKRDLLGFRRIDPIMYDNNVSSIYVDGLNKPVMVEFKGLGKIKSNIIFTETKDLNVLLARLAKATGNKISEEEPILDSDFEGYRVQAILGKGGASSKLMVKKISV